MSTVTAPPTVHTLIGGVPTEAGAVVPIRYPYDGTVVAHLHVTRLADVGRAVESAHEAWLSWRRTAAFERSRLLARLADLMGGASEELARTITLQSGKTIRESRAEVARSRATIAISAEEAKRICGEIIPMDAVEAGAGRLGFTMRVPMGVIAAITPFNAPLNTVCHKLGPALAAGNTVVIKPHPQGAGLATRMAELCLEAGIPPGVVNVVHGDGEIGRALTGHSSTALVNFTGSGRVADQIIREVGMKRVLLELGGNAPTIVHEDADLGHAIPLCVEAAFGLSGQSCISTQRILVHRSRYEEVVAGLVAGAESKRAGDPMDPATGIGPMVSEEAAERVETWVAEAVGAGATLRCGGRRTGALIDATVLTEVESKMKVVCEEVFGPIVTVSPYGELEEALELANDSPWGLKTGIFTSSLTTALRAARELEFGTINVNAASRSRLDHEPSGGVKASGWGKEGPKYAIEEMTYLKMVSITAL